MYPSDAFLFSREMSNSEHLQTNPGRVFQGLDFMRMASERQSCFLYSPLPVLNVDLFPGQHPRNGSPSTGWYCQLLPHWPGSHLTPAPSSFPLPSSPLLITLLLFSSIILITAKLKYYFVSQIQLLCIHLSIHPFILPFFFSLLMGIYFTLCPYESKGHLIPSVCI